MLEIIAGLYYYAIDQRKICSYHYEKDVEIRVASNFIIWLISLNKNHIFND